MIKCQNMSKLIKWSNSYMSLPKPSNTQSGSLSGLACCPPAFSVCTIPDASLRRGSLTVRNPHCILGTAHSHNSCISYLNSPSSSKWQPWTWHVKSLQESSTSNDLPLLQFSEVIALANAKTNGSETRITQGILTYWTYYHFHSFPYYQTCHFRVLSNLLIDGNSEENGRGQAQAWTAAISSLNSNRSIAGTSAQINLMTVHCWAWSKVTLTPGPGSTKWSFNMVTLVVFFSRHCWSA